MTTAQLIYATIATIGLSLGWRACFGWFKWWLAPVFTGAAVWAATLPATGQEILTDRVTHVRDGDTIVVGQSAIYLQGVHAPELDEPGGYLPAARTTDTPHPRILRLVPWRGYMLIRSNDQDAFGMGLRRYQARAEFVADIT